MTLTRLRGACDPKPTCPTLYLTDQGTLIIQGWIVDSPSTTDQPTSPDEGLVEVPVSLLWVPPTTVPCESPVVRFTDRDTVIVRGSVVDDPDKLARLTMPEGEMAVEVSISLLPEVVPSAQ